MLSNGEDYYLTKEMYLDKDKRRQEIERCMILQNIIGSKQKWNERD